MHHARMHDALSDWKAWILLQIHDHWTCKYLLGVCPCPALRTCIFVVACPTSFPVLLLQQKHSANLKLVCTKGHQNQVQQSRELTHWWKESWSQKAPSSVCVFVTIHVIVGRVNSHSADKKKIHISTMKLVSVILFLLAVALQIRLDRVPTPTGKK